MHFEIKGFQINPAMEVCLKRAYAIPWTSVQAVVASMSAPVPVDLEFVAYVRSDIFFNLSRMSLFSV